MPGMSTGDFEMWLEMFMLSTFARPYFNSLLKVWQNVLEA